MFDLNSLPVAPEFVESLQENAVATLCDYLKKTKAPREVYELVRSINDLAYYVTECYRDPESLQREQIDRFPIEEAIITTINALAKAGGTFRGPMTASFPRDIHVPAKRKRG